MKLSNFFFVIFFPRRPCALGYVSGGRTHAWGGPGLGWVAWPTRRRRATAAAPRSFVRGSAVGLDFSLQCTAARAGFTQEGVRTAFANRLCESLRCLDLRALILALSRTPRASLGTLSSHPKTLGRLKDICAS